MGVQQKGAFKNSSGLGGQVVVEKTLSQAVARRAGTRRRNDVDLLSARRNGVYVALGVGVSVIHT